MPKSQEFLPGTEYELETVQNLLGALKTNSTNIFFSEREIGGKKEIFVPSISISSTLQPGPREAYTMLPNPEEMKLAKAELRKYISNININKDGEYNAAGIVRVGGKTEAQIYRDGPKSKKKSRSPDSAAHYIAFTFSHKKNGNSELIITDPLGKSGEITGSYIQEIRVIEEEFRGLAKGKDMTIKHNPPGVIYQSDPHSCAPVCIYNLQVQMQEKGHTLSKISSPPHELGIIEKNKVAKVEPGAKALRLNQQELLEEERSIQEAIALSLDSQHNKVNKTSTTPPKPGIIEQNKVAKTEPGAKALRLKQQELLEERSIQEAIALSLDSKHKVADDVVKTQQRLLDRMQHQKDPLLSSPHIKPKEPLGRGGR